MTTRDSQRVYLAIDGGGSTCRARLSDHSGRVLATGTAGPANLRLGSELVRKQIEACTREALMRANMADYPLNRLHAGLGLAGAVLDEDLDSSDNITAMFASARIVSDAYIACLGAHLGHDGGIVIIGTGSCAQVISPALTRTYGGWGLDISDQASGAWLGRLAVQETVLALEELAPTSTLSKSIAAEIAYQSDGILRWSESAKPSDYAALAPKVFSAARQEDQLAMKLLQSGCEQLCLLIHAVAQHNTGRVSLLGGLAADYQQLLPGEVTAMLCPAQGDALDGALILAGLPVDQLKQT